ncbi:hypothetical protein OF83DRAFT_260399 [Amylostereum chailletii]|nr:hypothetical protein OF83DRAFT_260399 [Amylostereum chailletii]
MEKNPSSCPAHDLRETRPPLPIHIALTRPRRAARAQTPRSTQRSRSVLHRVRARALNRRMAIAHACRRIRRRLGPKHVVLVSSARVRAPLPFRGEVHPTHTLNDAVYVVHLPIASLAIGRVRPGRSRLPTVVPHDLVRDHRARARGDHASAREIISRRRIRAGEVVAAPLPVVLFAVPGILLGRFSRGRTNRRADGRVPTTATASWATPECTGGHGNAWGEHGVRVGGCGDAARDETGRTAC